MDSDEQISVSLVDRVTVRRGNDPATSWVENRHHHGQLFGDWYVRVTDGPDAAILSSPEAVFMVGHEPTGYRLICDLYVFPLCNYPELLSEVACT